MIPYPWVSKYSKLPIGHTTIHLHCEDIPGMLAKKGLVRCSDANQDLTLSAAKLVQWSFVLQSMKDVSRVGL